jgi:hypothetical protein
MGRSHPLASWRSSVEGACYSAATLAFSRCASRWRTNGTTSPPRNRAGSDRRPYRRRHRLWLWSGCLRSPPRASATSPLWRFSQRVFGMAVARHNGPRRLLRRFRWATRRASPPCRRAWSPLLRDRVALASLRTAPEDVNYPVYEMLNRQGGEGVTRPNRDLPAVPGSARFPVEGRRSFFGHANAALLRPTCEQKGGADRDLRSAKAAACR